ncbi:unnamed protein product [Sphagnum jensenii]|uniref:NB-ARC domain-containing protein n=1 Tax=Sphagnum jensenii TaxID=128206 RepID=A0ABP1BNA0_9BRYO
MLRNLFFGKRPSSDLDTERSVSRKASPSTTPSRASHDNYKENEGRSVHQLWPLEDHVRSTNFDVVYFHGLHWPSEKEAWKSTWTQLDDPQDCWPQNWLPQDLDENVRVLAISYDACPTQSEGKGSYDDVSEIGQKILETLVLSEWRLGQRGFVLIGHCFGGLVIKSLVEEARKRARLGNVRSAIDRKAKASAQVFLKNLKGVVFYAVPHSGSKNLISYFTRCNHITSILRRVVKLAGFMQNLQPLQLKTENLSTTFDAIVEEISISVYAFVEGKPMKDVGFRLVEKAAALRSAGENHYTLEDCDHSTVCKPSGKNHPSYELLLGFIRTCRQEVLIESKTYLGFEYNWKENFQFYVEPSNLPNILLQNLKEEGSKNILVYGGFGYGKTTLVKYVLYKNAKELDIIFHGGIFHMRYGHKDNEVLSCQKELIRALHLNPQELQGLECWQIQSVRAKLADLLNARSGPILLFIDDVWTGQMIDNSPEFFTTKGSKLLVTSRFNLKLNQPNWIRIEMNGTTNENVAARLLASKAANNPDETKFPLGCEKIAEKILFKCDGCLFAITIIGATLGENKAQTPEKWKDVYEKFEYYADNAPAAEDYKGESKTIFAAIKLSLEYGQEESDRVGMENILRTITLFENIEKSEKRYMWRRGCPAIVLHLAWSYLQPQPEINHFKMLLKYLIDRNLVDNSGDIRFLSDTFFLDSWEFKPLRLHELVKEYVLRKLPAIDICNVLEKGSEEKKFLLATFLPICKTRYTNLEFALSLGQFYYEKWDVDQLYTLLGSEAENAILLASQPHKVTQKDVNALFHLLNFDKIRAWAAACILARLAKHFYGDDILQHRSIQGFIQNLKHQWKIVTPDGKDNSYYICKIALMLVKYSTFAEQFAIDEDFMEIMTNIIMQNFFQRKHYHTKEILLLLFTLNQHKNVRNIFYQKYTKISMKNILKQISLVLIHETKFFQPTSDDIVWHLVFEWLNLSLQYEDMAMQIIDKGDDDIVLGIFCYFFTNVSISHDKTKVLFSILEGFAKQKEGEAIIIKHVHLLLRVFIGVHDGLSKHVPLLLHVFIAVHDGLSKLVRHKGIAQALNTQEGVELLVGALEQRKVVVVPPILQCLFFENEEFAYKVIARGGWRMITKGMQIMSSCGMFQFSLMHIAKEMASKGEIQELVMEVINGNNSEYCLKLLENLVTDHMDIMKEEFIAKGAIRFLLASLPSLNHLKKLEIITSGLVQRLAFDKGVKEMLAHTGIQMLVQLLVPGPNDNNGMNNWYVKKIVNIIKLSIKGLEYPMKLLKSSIDDIDVLKMHNTLLRQYHSITLLFFPQTLDVDINIAKEWLNSLGPPFNASNMSSCLHKDDYEGDYKNDIDVVLNLSQLSKHIDIASMIMANEGILERFLIQLSKGNLKNDAFQLLKVVLQHERVATDVVHQRPSFIKELLQLFLMERPTFKNDRRYSVASLLLVLAKHGGVFIKFIVNSDGIQIFLQEASLENWIGHCDVIEVLGIMAKDEDHALQIEKAGGSKMLLRAISCHFQYVHDTHLKKTMTIYKKSIMEYEDDHLVMCCLNSLSLLINHEEIAKQILTKECGIITLVDVMQTASQLWSSITLTLHESVISKKLMQIKSLMLTILSNVASTLALMAKLHPHIIISRKVNEDVLKGIFQLQGTIIDEHQALKKALQDLLDFKKFHTKAWNCQQLCSKTIDIQSYEGKLGECQAHFGVKGTSNEGQSSGTTKEDYD